MFRDEFVEPSCRHRMHSLAPAEPLDLNVPIREKLDLAVPLGHVDDNHQTVAIVLQIIGKVRQLKAIKEVEHSSEGIVHPVALHLQVTSIADDGRHDVPLSIGTVDTITYH